ncbi:hypothetical protein JYT24_00920 [Parvibaculum lavamentivorans]|nr:hypothetical protein [Parvibaculum lavamentivorans]
MAGRFLFLALRGSLAAAFFAVAFSANVAAADAVLLEGVENDGYGRLVIAWPEQAAPSEPGEVDERIPGYEAFISASVLVVTFDRAVEGDTEDLLRGMPRYFALIRTDENGKAFRFAMKSDFTLLARPAGYELYVDLLPATWTGAPPPLPTHVLRRLAKEEAEKARLATDWVDDTPRALEIAENPPSVVLRVGARPGTTRLAFDWDRPVLYSTAFRDNRITITFDQVADLPLAVLRVDPPAFIKSARTTEADGRLTVFIETEPGVKIRDFREDLSIVLDVSPAHGNAIRPTASALPTPLLPIPHGPSGLVVQQADTARAIEAQAAAAQEASGEEQPVHADHAAQAADVHDPDDVGAPSDELVAEEPDGHTGDHSNVAEAEMSHEPDVEEDHETETMQLGNAEEHEDAAAGGGNDDRLLVYAEQMGKSVRLTFPWLERVDAAIFQRDNRVWILFDREAEFDLSQLDPLVEERLGTIDVFQLPRASIFQFTPPERMLVAAAERDGQWIVTLGDVIVEPTRPVATSRTWDNTGDPHVLFDLSQAGQVHWVRDPVIQDLVAIVTAAGPPQGLLAPRNFVEFQALATAQGLAFVSRADDLYVRTSEEGVSVSRGSGLTLSAADGPTYSGVPVIVERPDPEEEAENSVTPVQMDFERWRFSPGRTFIERKQYHQLAIAAATEETVTLLRMRYAKFLLSYRLGVEADVVLEAALRDSEDLDTDLGFRALRGVARIMRGWPEEAVSDLSVPALAEEPQIALWLGVAYAELGEWQESWAAFERAEQAFAFYAPDIQALFRVKAAEAAMASGDFGTAEFNLDRVPAETEERRWIAQADLTRARIYEASGRIDEALEIYDALKTSDYRGIAARAYFAHVLLRHQLGALTDDALADELESLRFRWRGDDLELAVLEQLGEIRVAQGRIAEGLRVWRAAVGRFSETQRGRRIASRMSEAFAELYLGSDAGEMDAVEALTIYYNFRELTPIGRRGDALIRHLADRLVEVDLLDKAAGLLRHQVENRLRGTARAQVAAKLALIELMNHQPENALRAIRSTKQVRLPEMLMHKRRLLEARALSDIGLYDHALDLLSETVGDDVAGLVADIYWDSQQWDIAAIRFEEALGERWRDPQELTAAERFGVMRAAIGFSLSDDAEGLDRIRSKYGDLMRASSDAAGFAVVTDPIGTQGVAFRELARNIAATDTLDLFVESMRESFAEMPDNQETAIN